MLLADERPLEMPGQVSEIIASRCLDCHTGDEAEAGVRFDNFPELRLPAKLELMNRAQDQVFFGLMPPEDSDQLIESEESLLSGWLRKTLRSHDASKLDEKLRYPQYGNYVDHQKLFDGSIDEKPFTPARRWLVSPQIFHERVNAVFQLEGRERQRTFYGVTNPIILPDNSGVRYYDTTALDGGHLLIMLNNARWIADKQLLAARHAGQDRRKIEFANPKDRWVPPRSPPELVAVVRRQGTPIDDELAAAISAQFQCVLQRKPTDSELREHLQLFRSAVKLAGNEDGLRQMLVSVLLKSEFLYRIEFGEGEVDSHGRRKLSPREAAYAIAYAISDRGPDAALVKAAQDGRLASKEDYKREVTRLVTDKQTFYDAVDPTISGISPGSHKSTHPKLVRFFREFFGYPASMKLFKDELRSDGFYDNGSRGYTGTAGYVTDEADRVVDYILNRDQNVFEQLLTTDQNFVLHTRSNEEGQKIVEEWRKAYAGLKDTAWKEDVEQALLDNFEAKKDLFAIIRITNLEEKRRKVHVRDFERFMIFFENTFGQGVTPITYPWFFHGGQKYRHAEIYNLPPVAGAGPLHYKGRLSRGEYPEGMETWSFQTQQPFSIPNRKGLLTHPAWLLAHSQNTETDPVRRGRWIREKLLAGHVPDVPITVDAQIPEDHHRSLRERLDSVTLKQECWKCHQQMNPLGLTFEVFDDFGRFRKFEALEHPDNILPKATKNSPTSYKTKPVAASGMLTGSGREELDGPVEDAFDLIDRLARSDKVRQSIIRHAFRFFLGRNEMLSDSQTLIEADQAYLKSGGSFRAVVVSLLTSDSFMYRKPQPDA